MNFAQNLKITQNPGEIVSLLGPWFRDSPVQSRRSGIRNYYSKEENSTKKTFIECKTKLEFYEFTDRWSEECPQFKKNVKMEIHLEFDSKSNEYFDCFRYDSFDSLFCIYLPKVGTGS
jgi:uncharacterized protein with ParB-like and HNH nuclease domain